MCSYCAIPIITGHYQSRPMEDIIEEIEMLVRKGVKRISDYSSRPYLLWDGYLQKILYCRIGRSHCFCSPSRMGAITLCLSARFPYDLLPVMRKHANVCKYLDIALQHISDNMLRMMHRHVTKEETYELLSRIRKEVPGIHIRTTLMVGHPGEGESDFEELKEFVRKARFERMGAFAYSEEEGTFSAEHYSDDIPEEVKQRRLDELMAIQEEIAAEINVSKVGQEMKVIIDREEERILYRTYRVRFAGS